MADSNSNVLFSHVADCLNRFPLAYLHIIEPRVSGSELIHKNQGALAAQQLRSIFNGKLIVAGGFEPDTAAELVRSGTADAIAFGRHFVANPDLPRRIHDGLPLAEHDRSTFYTFDSHGYTDYTKFEHESKFPPSSHVPIATLSRRMQ